eukprot:6401087-Amphidinium_carterae.1
MVLRRPHSWKTVRNKADSLHQSYQKQLAKVSASKPNNPHASSFLKERSFWALAVKLTCDGACVQCKWVAPPLQAIAAPFPMCLRS